MRKLLASLILFLMVINLLPAVSSLSDGVSVEYIPGTFNLGVGVSSPSSKLTINGDLAIKEASAPSLSTNYGKLFVNSTTSNLTFLDDAGTSYDLLNALTGGGGATNIEGLSDGKSNVYNVYLGNGAGASSPDIGASYSTGVGINALASNQSGGGLYNTAFGYDALEQNWDGDRNTAIGAFALRNCSSSNCLDNTAVGSYSLYSNTLGTYNTAVGGYSLYYNTGLFNTGIGYESLYTNSSGSENTALGYESLHYNEDGSRSVAVGYQAGRGAATSSYSNGVFLGYYAGGLNSTGDNNICIGYRAGDNINTGSNNIIIGYDTDASNPAASNQLNIGNTIYGNTSTGNVGLSATSPGAKLDVESSAASDGIDVNNTATDGDPRIAFQLSGTSTFTMGIDDGDSDKFKIGTSAIDTNTRFTIDSTGNIGLGTSSPSIRLDIESSAASDGIDLNNTATDGDPRIAFQLSGTSTFTMGIDDSDSDKFKIGTSAIDTNTRFLIDASGNVGIATASPVHKLQVTGTAGLSTGTAWTNTSDIRLKNIDGDYEYGLAEIMKLHSVRFHYKDGNVREMPSDIPLIGFIAQEVQPIFPEAVSQGKDGYLDFNIHPISVAMVNAVQELKAEIDQKDARIAKLEDELSVMKLELCKKNADLSFCK